MLWSILCISVIYCKSNLNDIMQGYINKNKIEYILFHINQYIEISDSLKKNIIFLNNQNQIIEYQAKIIFLLSDEKLIKEKIFSINNIPILFPNSDEMEWFSFDNNNLIFKHDILKSAFYLLSCYQEYKSNNIDEKGRYLFSSSIQKQFNFIHRPIVNYYFEILAKGIERYCKQYDLPFRLKRETGKCMFLLSHDIDRIDYYSINGILLKCKEIFHLTPTYYTFSQNIILLFKQFFHNSIPKKSDPYWDFDYLLGVEEKFNLKSIFYFLHKDIKHYDGYYTFKMPKIRKLLQRLLQNGNEIGLHNSIGATYNPEKTFFHLNQLKEASNNEIIGVRQHFLKIKVPTSMKQFNNVGLIYDTSLCFAEQEGFRSSYCYPHKMYDFDSDQMLNIWEIPLLVMDCTLLDYRKLDFDSAYNIIQTIINESKKFGGIATVLWHNGYFDEIRFPGITKFYERVLEYFSLNSISCLSEDVLNYYSPINKAKN